jgi:long-chain acyl-CoA synthetase
MRQHVEQILERAADAYPDRVALLDVGVPGAEITELTYGQWRAAALRWATWLEQADVRDGDRVALLAGNGLSFAAQWFGVVYAGCTVVPIPVNASVEDARHRIEHARCRVLLCDDERLPLARDAITHVRQRPIVALDSELATEQAPVMPRFAHDGGDEATAMILYTSGTTGQAKGACISHRALVTHTQVLTEQVLMLDGHDRVLGVLPLTHSYGCRMLLLAVAHAGATAVLMPRFDAARGLSLIDTQRITWIPAVPTMFAAWSNAVDRDPMLKPQRGSLRWAMSAGAPIADALVVRAEAALGTTVRQAYGLTEATLSSVNGPVHARVLGSVGRPVPGVELRVGETGEIWVRGHNTMSGYLDEPDATAEVMQDGWCRSGDVGRIDPDGNLWLVDRIKDLIIVGGFNVYPAEVESVIARHSDVSEVAVVGRPHDYYGEEVVAFVVRKADSALDEVTLLSWCEARLSKVKRPRAVVFRESFPVGPSGKVLKRDLRVDVPPHAETEETHGPT